MYNVFNMRGKDEARVDVREGLLFDNKRFLTNGSLGSEKNGRRIKITGNSLERHAKRHCICSATLRMHSIETQRAVHPGLRYQLNSKRSGEVLAIDTKTELTWADFYRGSSISSHPYAISGCQNTR